MSEENNIIDLDEENIVELEDEDGTKVLFELLDYFEYRKHDYVVLIPMDDEEGDSVVILQVEPVDEENENYIPVANETVLNAVFEEFKKRNPELYEQ